MGFEGGVAKGVSQEALLGQLREGELRRLRIGLWAISLVVGILALLTLALAVGLDKRLSRTEALQTLLDEDLDAFFAILEQELGEPQPRPSGDKIKRFQGDIHQWEVQEEGEKSSRRFRRQVAFPNVPDSFGPGVPRTEQGVPVLNSAYRSDLKPQPVQPTPDSQGLRLYEGLVATGGRNEPKSPEFSGVGPSDSLLPHHKVSAAWSDKAAAPRTSSIQLRAGDLGLLGGDRYGGPRFSNQRTYRRSSNSLGISQGGGRHRERSGPYGSPLASTHSHSPSTYHRNSRVAATGDYLPHASSTNYAKLRRLPLGRGQGDVIARVVQSSDTDVSNRARSRSWGNLRKPGSRRRGSQVHLRRRPEETRWRSRSVPTPTPRIRMGPNGAGVSDGRLNVTIEKSIPFYTYYNAKQANWAPYPTSY